MSSAHDWLFRSQRTHVTGADGLAQAHSQFSILISTDKVDRKESNMPRNIKRKHWRRHVTILGIALLIFSSNCATSRQVTYIVGVTAIQGGVERVLSDSTYSLQHVVIRLSTGGRIKAEEIVFDGRTGEFRTDGIQGRIQASRIDVLAPKGRDYTLKANDGASSGTDGKMVMRDALFSTGKATITARQIQITWL